MNTEIIINGHKIGPDSPTYFIAEMSGNHIRSYERAAELLHMAAAIGVNAVKLQTYTAGTITLDCDNEFFTIRNGLWAGRKLYELYKEAYTPWEWQPKLKKLGDELGVEIFSTPFDTTAVDFLENDVGVNVYKIASFELVDIQLLEKIATTGKPVIMSTGMATLSEIDRAVRTLRSGGTPSLALLKCVSSYPATPDQMNLSTIPHLAQAFDCVPGLSDHSLSAAVSVASVALGACIVEKHFTLDRNDGGPDASFSLEPNELRYTLEMIREAEAAIGRVSYGVGFGEKESIIFRKSLFVVKDMKKGETFNRSNLRVIRPGHGLRPAYIKKIIGRVATEDIYRGTPLSWALVGGIASDGEYDQSICTRPL